MHELQPLVAGLPGVEVDAYPVEIGAFALVRLDRVPLRHRDLPGSATSSRPSAVSVIAGSALLLTVWRAW